MKRRAADSSRRLTLAESSTPDGKASVTARWRRARAEAALADLPQLLERFHTDSIDLAAAMRDVVSANNALLSEIRALHREVARHRSDP